jgi:hypothetical protein
MITPGKTRKMKLKRINSPVPDCSAYRSTNNLTVICGREPCGPLGELRWHLSIAHHNRYPTWDEIRDVRYELIPDETVVAMFLPPCSENVNEHLFCFHLFEVEAEGVPQSLIMP